METQVPITDAQKIHIRTKKMLLYIGIFSIVMLFAGLTSAYVVSQADSFWVDIRLPDEFTISTAVIILSSFTMWFALRSAKNNNFSRVRSFILLTLLLGIVFSIFQYMGWKDLFYRGHTFRGENIFQIQGEYGKDYSFLYKGVPLDQVDGEFYEQSDKLHERPLRDRILGSRDVASSFLITITVVHLLHLVGGLIYLLVVYGGAVRKKFDSSNTLRLELCSTYWHFLGGLWIYLFLFLLFIH